jgi:hypothetical protein
VAAGDLTTVEKVRIQAGLDDLVADAVLEDMIASSSAWFKGEIGADILLASYTDTFDGKGLTGRGPSNRPVISVTSVTVDGSVVSPRPAVSSTNTDPDGWYLDGDRVELRGSTFSYGYRNCVIVYRAGYGVEGEARTVPAVAPFTIATARSCAGVVAVTLADGTVLVEVASSPAAGQFSVAGGTLTFAEADAGAAVLLSYASVPADLELAVKKHVILEYRRRGREGQGSASGLGDSVSYNDAGDWKYILDTIERYRARMVHA